MIWLIGLFLALLASMFRTAWQRRNEPMALGFLAGFTGLFVHAIIVNSLLFAPIMLYLFVAAGVIHAKKAD